MRNEMVLQKILNEIERIRWEVERVEKNVLMARSFGEKAFQEKKSMGRLVSSQPDGADEACVFTTHLLRLSHEDKKFIASSSQMTLIFRLLVEHNPYILFTYLINKRGVTRGYPRKDFSVLPDGFDPTRQDFYLIADERHNPRRRLKWTEPYLCPLIKTWMVTCSAPLWRDSDFIGVIGIDVNLGKIMEPLGRALRMTETGYAFIISPKGNLIISSEAGMESLREDGIWIEGKWKYFNWRSMGAKRGPSTPSFSAETQIKEIDLTSGQRLLLSTYFKTTGWNLVTLLPVDIAGGATDGVSFRKAPAASVPERFQEERTYLPLISFVSAYSRSLQQIEKMIEGTKMIGKGVLDHRIKVNRKDEIGLLAHSINKMAKELKKGKEEFEAAYKKISQLDRLMALGRLTSGIAHEINNPLGVISNYVQVLLRNPSLTSEVKIDLMLMEEEILAMMGIIRGLLNFSRESEMNKGPANLNDVLGKIVSLLKYQLNSQSIKLVENYEGGLPFILGDPNHLQQVFLNILLNSIQSMPDGGTLELRTHFGNGGKPETSRGWVVVEVSDTGVGIESRFLDKIFDPFFTTKGWGAGTGLGLSISYGIIKEHGGTIDVKSTPGKGTQVRTSFPLPVETIGGTEGAS